MTLPTHLSYSQKGAPSVSLKAMKAIMFLLDCFTSRHSHVCEQSLEEVRKDKKENNYSWLFIYSQVHTTVPCFDIDSNDDRILHCCLVYKQKLVATSKNGTVLVCGDIVCFLDKVVLLCQLTQWRNYPVLWCSHRQVHSAGLQWNTVPLLRWKTQVTHVCVRVCVRACVCSITFMLGSIWNEALMSLSSWISGDNRKVMER